MWTRALSGILLLFAASCSSQAQRCSLERISWTPEVRLGIGDFAGSLGTDQHTAEANTGIATNSRSGNDPATFIVEAVTFFDPCKSWFRRGLTDSATLAHERLHFDITELYARRLMARYASEIEDHRAFLRKHETIYLEVWEASRRKQEEYDQEVYRDRARQSWWAQWVEEQLEATQAHANKLITLPM